ncbi:MAG: S8 family serine peptidase [Streptosporangiales bacterium]|nr:S8 family serine peptidase [Streptosporangiales bacterium]
MNAPAGPPPPPPPPPPARDARRRRRWPLPAGLAVAALLTGVVAAPAYAEPRADPVRERQMPALRAIRADDAWKITKGRGVTVAVLDTGVVPTVKDLAGAVRTGPDFTGTGNDPGGPAWGEHGTLMATLIAGRGHGPGFTAGAIGVAPQATILSLRVTVDDTDPGRERFRADPTRATGVAQAIRYAVDHGATVINLSLGGFGSARADRQALDYALARGVVVVGAAGNEGRSGFTRTYGFSRESFPGGYAGVIGVGAVDERFKPATFSSRNATVSVSAPGVRLVGAGAKDDYYWVNGTSGAAALVTGVAALIKARHPLLPPALVARALTDTTRERPKDGYDVGVGFGVVDAEAALRRSDELAAYRPTAAPGETGRREGGGVAAEATTAVPTAPVANGEDAGGSAVPRWALLLIGAMCVVTAAVAARGLALVAVARRSARRRP